MYKFEKLVVWKKALSLIKLVYTFSEEIKDFILRDQIRRAVTSICINIAEGSGAQNDKEFNRYLYISRKSLFEVAACLKIIEEIYQKRSQIIEKEIAEVGKLLHGLIKKIKSDIS